MMSLCTDSVQICSELYFQRQIKLIIEFSLNYENSRRTVSLSPWSLCVICNVLSYLFNVQCIMCPVMTRNKVKQILHSGVHRWNECCLINLESALAAWMPASIPSSTQQHWRLSLLIVSLLSGCFLFYWDLLLESVLHFFASTIVYEWY